MIQLLSYEVKTVVDVGRFSQKLKELDELGITYEIDQYSTMGQVDLMFDTDKDGLIAKKLFTFFKEV